MPSYSFHQEAAEEYLAAVRRYVRSASPSVAMAFVTEVEFAIKKLLKSATTWPIVAEPGIRRFLLRRFPYSLYYHVDPRDHVVIYSVSHQNREPNYWHKRLN